MVLLTQCGLVALYGDSESTMAEVMVCWLTAPSHYLNQCSVFISEVHYHSVESKFTASGQATILINKFEDYTFKIAAASPKGQWVQFRQWSPRIFWCFSGVPLVYQSSGQWWRTSCFLRTPETGCKWGAGWGGWNGWRKFIKQGIDGESF